jgi:hypothetical protein
MNLRLTYMACCALSLAPVALTTPPPRPTVQMLAWLDGNWVQKRSTTVVREHWGGPYGDTMLGFGLTAHPNGTTTSEFFRIANTPAGISYYASPNAAAPTEFPAIEITRTRVVFENRQHDFPQRIIYHRQPDGTLHARIEGTLNGKVESVDWYYRRDDVYTLLGPVI